MKKLLVITLALVAIGFVASKLYAEEKYVAGGFEASGHINTGFGFSYIGKDAAVANTGGAVTFIRDGWIGFDTTAKSKDFGFILDEVELDLTKTFGENIAFRTDLDFGDNTIGSSFAGVRLEQAYVTANIAAGNGIELLFGRFAAPIGFEAPDRNDNDTITRSILFNGAIRPITLTGAKLYYAFTDAVDFHFYVVNNLGDGIYADFNSDANIIPSGGFRLGYTWGEEGSESSVGLGGAVGPEQAKAGKKIGYMTYLGDLDWNLNFVENLTVGGEGIFRLDSEAGADTKYFGGLLNLNYDFSDVWDGTLKYALLWQNNGPGTISGNLAAGKALFHEIGLAGGYQITDGAKFGAEYRLDWTKYTGANLNLSHAFLGNFAYIF